jgi:uncharacterized protein YfiM (DUF2279 family)
MGYTQNDGGRAAAGYKGMAGDCGARALAIATGMDYQQAYSLIAVENKNMGFAKSARNGVHKNVYERVLKSLGWQWKSAPKFEGRKARCSDLTGTVIAQQAGHYVAVINGIPQDIWDCSHKMVYGYWAKD